MYITINGKNLKIADNTSVYELITQLGYKDKRIAVEVNEVIVPKSSLMEFNLNVNDKVEIIKAVGGG